jgi:hypothetical protein
MQSGSASSQQLSKQSSEAKALQTLDQRHAAQAAQNDAANGAQAAPGDASQGTAQPAGAPAPAQGPTTVIVHQDGGGLGLGHVLAGAMIARSVAAHAHGGGYPAPGPGYNGGYNGANGSAHSGMSVASLFVTLCLLALIAWGAWFAWQGWRKRRAALAEAKKPNYSFERN